MLLYSQLENVFKQREIPVCQEKDSGQKGFIIPLNSVQRGQTTNYCYLYCPYPLYKKRPQLSGALVLDQFTRFLPAGLVTLRERGDALISFINFSREIYSQRQIGNLHIFHFLFFYFQILITSGKELRLVYLAKQCKRKSYC